LDLIRAQEKKEIKKIRSTSGGGKKVEKKRMIHLSRLPAEKKLLKDFFILRTEPLPYRKTLVKGPRGARKKTDKLSRAAKWWFGNLQGGRSRITREHFSRKPGKPSHQTLH